MIDVTEVCEAHEKWCEANGVIYDQPGDVLDEGHGLVTLSNINGMIARYQLLGDTGWMNLKDISEEERILLAADWAECHPDEIKELWFDATVT